MKNNLSNVKYKNRGSRYVALLSFALLSSLSLGAEEAVKAEVVQTEFERCIVDHDFECASAWLKFEPEVNAVINGLPLTQFLSVENCYGGVMGCGYSREKQQRFMRFVILLASNGLDLDRGDERGFTMLHYVSFSGDAKAVTLLLELGASRSVRDKAGRTPLDIANLRKTEGEYALSGTFDEIIALFKSDQG